MFILFIQPSSRINLLQLFLHLLLSNLVLLFIIPPSFSSSNSFHPPFLFILLDIFIILLLFLSPLLPLFLLPPLPLHPPLENPNRGSVRPMSSSSIKFIQRNYTLPSFHSSLFLSIPHILRHRSTPPLALTKPTHHLHHTLRYDTQLHFKYILLYIHYTVYTNGQYINIYTDTQINICVYIYTHNRVSWFSI